MRSFPESLSCARLRPAKVDENGLTSKRLTFKGARVPPEVISGCVASVWRKGGPVHGIVFLARQETLSMVETSCWDLLASIEENCERYSPAQCPTEQRCAVYEREIITEFDLQTGCPIEETISECVGFLPGYSGRIAPPGPFVFEGCEE